MPGYIIHLAIGKEYIKKHYIKNREEFFNGIIAPDLFDKKSSHYCQSDNLPDFRKFLEENSLDSDYNKGYLLHLISDYLFYNKYLACFSDKIYCDYNKLNEHLIYKYDIKEIPSEIKQIVKFESGKTQILNFSSICKFIEEVSIIEFCEIKNLDIYLKEYELKSNSKEEIDR